MNTKRVSILIILLNIFLIVSAQQQFSINSSWLFSPDNEKWENVNLPHSWNTHDVMDDEPGYLRDICTYKKQLVINEKLRDKALYLKFEGVNQIADIYINGNHAGKHIGGYTAFYISLDGFVKFGDDNPNEIIVKVDNRHNDNVPPLSADFTFFGGIYRDVFLVAKNKVHFSVNDYSSEGIYLSTPEVTKEKASLNIKTLITNSSKNSEEINIITTLYDAGGVMVAKNESGYKKAENGQLVVEQTIESINSPNLWSPEDPYLYKATTQVVSRDGEILDEQMNPVGFRWFRFDSDSGFYLNDKHYKLIGASRHQDFKYKANALSDDYGIRDVELLKQMGANFLRIAHYPQDRSIMEACDRLGIIASIEIPLVNAITESKEFTDNSMQMLMEMLRQYHNHPSLVIWCYMNEILLRDKFTDDPERNNTYHQNVFKLAELIENTIRNEDPSRYTMHVGHGSYNKYRNAGLVDLPMIAGWNIYNGWYSGTFDRFSAFLDRFHRDYPEKILAITEYGADNDPRIRSNNPIRFDKSAEYANLFHQYYYKSMMERPFVAAAMIWNLADFNSEQRGETMPHINNKGILTWDRKIKDQYLFYQTQLSSQPEVKILNSLWDKRSGVGEETDKTSTQLIHVASNEPIVELIVNGVSIGNKNIEDGLTIWDVPFKDGQNTLVAKTANTKDSTNIEFILHPYTFSEKSGSIRPLNILLGTNRSFIDPETKVVWIPDQPYREGSFGHIGGEPYSLPNSNRTPFGTDKDISLTDNDPLFQTQQIGIEAYKFDVPAGKYELTLNFAELEGVPQVELAYNLGSDTGDSKETDTFNKRIFDIIINERLIIDNINIDKDFGSSKAVSIKIPVIVNDKNGITIDFTPIENKAILNSIQLMSIL